MNLSEYAPDSSLGMRPNFIHISDKVTVGILREMWTYLVTATLLDPDAVCGSVDVYA
jgi:hypothetical protein